MPAPIAHLASVRGLVGVRSGAVLGVASMEGRRHPLGAGRGCPDGWANTSVGQDADAPRELQLEGLYVLDGHHGTGVGQALLDAAIGDRPAYLWALDVNSRAHVFSRRNGFALDGATRFDELWEVTEVRFVR